MWAEQDLNRYRRIPFEKKGRSFDGADCYGFLALFYRHELGLELRDYGSDYELAADYARALAAHVDDEWISTDAPRDGDGVVIADVAGKGAPHVGVFLEPNRLLMMTDAGVVDAVFGDATHEARFWRDRVVSFRRHRRR